MIWMFYGYDKRKKYKRELYFYMDNDIRELVFTDSENKDQLNNIRLVCEDIIQNCLYELGYKNFNYIRPLQWNYILMEIQRIIFKNNPLILHVNNRINNQYDYKKVLTIYYLFKSLSSKYNQEINRNRFLYFTGIDSETLYNWEKAKLGGFGLGEIIRRDSEQSMSEMLGDKGVNALGTIAKLNHYFGWREDGNRTQNINISVSESPKVIADRYKAALTDSKLSDNTGQNAD